MPKVMSQGFLVILNNDFSIPNSQDIRYNLKFCCLTPTIAETISDL